MVSQAHGVGAMLVFTFANAEMRRKVSAMCDAVGIDNIDLVGAGLGPTLSVGTPHEHHQ